MKIDRERLSCLSRFDYISASALMTYYSNEESFIDDRVFGVKGGASPAMMIGKAVHSAVLEPDRFETDYVHMPKFTGTGSVNLRNDFKDNVKGTILSDSQYEDVVAMTNGVRKNRMAVEMLDKSEKESVYLSEKVLHHPFSLVAIPDCVATDGEFLADLKVTSIESDAFFEQALIYRNYWIQVGVYMMVGESEKILRDDATFKFIFVNSKSPHNCYLAMLSDDVVQSCKYLTVRLLEKYAENHLRYREAHEEYVNGMSEYEVREKFLPQKERQLFISPWALSNIENKITYL